MSFINFSGSSIALSIEETVEAGSKSICAENNPATQVLAVSPQTFKDPQKMNASFHHNTSFKL